MEQTRRLDLIHGAQGCRDRTISSSFSIAVAGVALGGIILGFASGVLSTELTGITGYVALVLLLGSLWKARHGEDLEGACRIFPEPLPKSRIARKMWKIAAAATVAAGIAAALQAQQTIFNIPSADVLDAHKTYLEADALWRPQQPGFALFTARGVYGFGANIEAGVNFGGFLTPGRSVPIATPNVKWQPWHNDKLAITTGAFGLFYLRGSRDGNPAALAYAEVSYKLPTDTRLTAGAYAASSGYAARDPQAGALVGFEQKINDHLNVIADWISGTNGIGYFTPGVSIPLKSWTIYAGYSLKNGDSKGNAALFELGFTF